MTGGKDVMQVAGGRGPGWGGRRQTAAAARYKCGETEKGNAASDMV